MNILVEKGLGLGREYIPILCVLIQSKRFLIVHVWLPFFHGVDFTRSLLCDLKGSFQQESKSKTYSSSLNKSYWTIFPGSACNRIMIMHTHMHTKKEETLMCLSILPKPALFCTLSCSLQWEKCRLKKLYHPCQRAAFEVLYWRATTIRPLVLLLEMCIIRNIQGLC